MIEQSVLWGCMLADNYQRAYNPAVFAVFAFNHGKLMKNLNCVNVFGYHVLSFRAVRNSVLQSAAPL